MTNIPISAHTGFQSTRPRGGATRATSPPRGAAPCFNPRAREGRDGIGVVVWPRDFEFQSTRPRGARRVAVLARVATSAVSIHAPARGATLTVSHRSLPPRQFQSTRPRGARRSGCRIPRRQGWVSIHAPARGATWPCRGSPLSRGSFNPRAREGRDSSSDVDAKRSKSFQSTRPRGARLSVMVTPLLLLAFQSARPRGARPTTSTGAATSSISFNPRAREGRDVARCWFAHVVLRFNPRAREGREAPRPAL